MIKKFLLVIAVALVALLPVAPAFGSHAGSRAAAASASKLKLLSSSKYVDSDGELHVVGEVRNIWHQTCGDCSVTVELLTSSGKKVRPTESFDSNPVKQPLDNFNLDPGQSSSFEIYADTNDYPGAVSYKILGLTAASAYSPSNQNFSISGLASSTTGGYNAVTGTITNNNLTAQDDPSIYGIWRESGGKLVDAAIGLLSSGCGTNAAKDNDTIAPGGSCLFEIDQAPGAPTGGVSALPASFVFATVTDDPSPMVAKLPTAKSKHLAFGGDIAISATVYKGDSIGTVPSGVPVALQESHGKSWQTLKSVKTDSDGEVNFGKRTFTSDATLRFETPGKSPMYTGSRSKSFTITVARGVSVKFTSKNEHSSVVVTAKGLVGPKAGGTRVYLEEKSGGWKKIGSAKVKGSGAYTLIHSFTKVGHYPLRMYAPASHGEKSATSATSNLTIRSV